MDTTSGSNNNSRLVQISAGVVDLTGNLSVAHIATGIVLLASESQSSQFANIAQLLQSAGYSTLSINLLTQEEIALDEQTGFFRENVEVLHQRIVGIANWLLMNLNDTEAQTLRICYFGIGVIGAAALIAAAERPDAVVAVVSVAGRFDLAKEYLENVLASTLLLADESDTAGIDTNRETLEHLSVDEHKKKFETVSGITKLFENENAQQEVVRVVSQWLERQL